MEDTVNPREQVGRRRDRVKWFLWRGNGGLIPNYDDRYRQGETISTAFVESAVNQVMS